MSSSSSRSRSRKATWVGGRTYKGALGMVPTTAATWVCEGACGRRLPRTKYPTTTGQEYRTAECRACRDKRQGRAEKAAAKRAAAAVAEAEAAERKAVAAAKRAADREAKRAAAAAAAAAPAAS